MKVLINFLTVIAAIAFLVIAWNKLLTGQTYITSGPFWKFIGIIIGIAISALVIKLTSSFLNDVNHD